MSSTETIGENAIQSVGFESVERDEEKVKGLALDAATQTHFSSVKDALMEVAKADAQRTQTVARPAAKNSMITTFKIMKIVMETLRKTSDSGKEMNKLLKQEWEAVSNKQSKNHEKAKASIDGSGIWQVASGLAAFSDKFAGPVLSAAGKGAGRVGWQAAVQHINANKDSYIKTMEGAKSTLSSIFGQIGTQTVQVQQYEVGIKESLYSHEVQTHTSEYQNASQQQTSDKQAVDNAADTAKQLIRVQGEILMGKAG